MNSVSIQVDDGNSIVWKSIINYNRDFTLDWEDPDPWVIQVNTIHNDVSRGLHFYFDTERYIKRLWEYN